VIKCLKESKQYKRGVLLMVIHLVTTAKLLKKGGNMISKVMALEKTRLARSKLSSVH
jgi:hypothetical protein